jgi:3-oxoacyl-[acyl-carrier protein] reductase
MAITVQAYASAKAGLIGFTARPRASPGPFGIRVNSIGLGFMRSNPASDAPWRAMGEAGQRALIDSIAPRRRGAPEDIARVVRLFRCDDAVCIAGQTISVDGGHWMLG